MQTSFSSWEEPDAFHNDQQTADRKTTHFKITDNFNAVRKPDFKNKLTALCKDNSNKKSTESINSNTIYPLLETGDLYYEPKKRNVLKIFPQKLYKA